MIYIALDDTDMLDTRGTGHLAREIAAQLAETYPLIGVTRHQLSSDPRVPCTHKNSSAVIHLDAPADAVPVGAAPELPPRGAHSDPSPEAAGANTRASAVCGRAGPYGVANPLLAAPGATQ